MQMNQLRYLVEAARLLSFSKASESLYVTQPTLSQQIRKLEEEVGTALFYRHSHSVSLTPAGEEFYLYACRILNDSDHIVARMQDYSNASRGRIRLGVFWLFTYLDLADPIVHFTRAHPDVDLTLIPGGSNDLYGKLTNREIDAAILILPKDRQADPNYYYKKLHHDEYGLIVNTDHPLCVKKEINITDLRGQNVIMPSRSSSLYDMITSDCFRNNVQFHVISESSHSDINAWMVSQGLAVSFSTASVAAKLNTGSYIWIPFSPLIERDVFFTAPSYYVQNPALSELLKSL